MGEKWRVVGRPRGVLVLLAALACGDGVTEVDTRTFQGCPVSTYLVGTTVGGALTTEACLLVYQGDQAGEYVDYYSFTLASHTGVTLELFSDQFSAYLVLWNRATGQVVAEGGPDGDELVARISVVLPPGRYVLGATTFWPGETGSYTLSSHWRAGGQPAIAPWPGAALSYSICTCSPTRCSWDSSSSS